MENNQINVAAEMSINERIKAFAKANKVGAGKLQEFIDSIMPKAPQTGRKASDTILKVREAFKAEYKTLGESFTSKDIAAKYDIPLADANNILNYFAKAGMIYVSGKASGGKRGKPSNLWSAK